MIHESVEAVQVEGNDEDLVEEFRGEVVDGGHGIGQLESPRAEREVRAGEREVSVLRIGKLE